MKKIIEFQERNGLVPDGIIGRNTFAKLKEVLDINNINCMAHFLGQVAHETQNFKRYEENLYYTTPERIVEVFKYDFDENKNRVIDPLELAHAKFLTRNPEALANFVYQNQNGNGDESTGDGYRFRGRGAIQLTGRDNYQQFSEFIKDDCVAKPDLVATKYYFQSALFFFNTNGVWRNCKKVDDLSIELVTRKINGGTNGLYDRKSKTYNFLTLLHKYNG